MVARFNNGKVKIIPFFKSLHIINNTVNSFIIGKNGGNKDKRYKGGKRAAGKKAVHTKQKEKMTVNTEKVAEKAAPKKSAQKKILETPTVSNESDVPSSMETA